MLSISLNTPFNKSEAKSLIEPVGLNTTFAPDLNTPTTFPAKVWEVGVEVGVGVGVGASAYTTDA